MIHKDIYECEICHAKFPTESQAFNCERKHARILSLPLDVHYEEEEIFPRRITIQFDKNYGHLDYFLDVKVVTDEERTT